MEKEVKFHGLRTSDLHILAMALMLCDHLWATFFLDYQWLTTIGRIAFPIFAFMIVEGYYHTHDLKKYCLRLLLGAVISEIPFNLVYGNSVIYPYHQNVIWTLLLGLLLILMIEQVKKKNNLILTVLISILAVVLGFAIGMLAMLDFYGFGVLTVLVFYFFHGKKWWCFLGQLLCLYYINVELMGGYCFNITLLGHKFEVVQQGFALLALIPIWLYSGQKGIKGKGFQYFCYLFYPLHFMVLYLIYRILY